MRSFSAHRHLRAILAVAVALLYLCNVGLTNAEEISFYGEDGSIFTITLTGGCYTFKSDWDKKAIAGEIDRGCFHVWDRPGCLGEKRKLTNGQEELRDFKKIDFNKKISSVSLCSSDGELGGASSRPIDRDNRYPERERDRHPPLPERGSSRPSELDSPRRGPKPPEPLTGMSLQQVRDTAVAEHNKYRARHGAQALQGDSTMNDEAQKYAEFLASTNKFELNRNARWIGNIASSVRRNPEDAIKDAVSRWYDGVNYYDFNNPGFSGSAGSFTAVVWKATSHMGIGAAWNANQNNWVIISYYAPSPNLQGAFKENVQAASR